MPGSIVLTAAYAFVIVVICVYGAHRYWLLWLFYRSGKDRRLQDVHRQFDDLPTVTVQLPMFNERALADRVIRAACGLDYPREKLKIQVLDDSTDESAEIARRCCERMRNAEHRVEYVHRTNRDGFKAGALDCGLRRDDSEFVAVFDADFIPPRDFLRRTIHQFTDERVGLVQAGWSHINRHESILIECQAMFLDGHFVVEQTARCGAGRWFNFNGTAGIWRRSSIDDAGGWQHDTLTEDTDLSYRAQIRRWKFVYLPDLACPAQLPPTVTAFLSQQHRWNKGMIETWLKLWPSIMRSGAPFKVKLEAWFHLTSPVIYVAIVALTLLALPAFLLLPAVAHLPFVWGVGIGALMLFFGTIAAGAFYAVSQVSIGFRLWETILYLPVLMAVGIGLSVVNTKAVFEALLGISSPFVRTPKTNEQQRIDSDQTARTWARLFPQGMVEILLGAIAMVCFGLTFVHPFSLIGAPFLLLFACGYLSIGIPVLSRAITRRRAKSASPAMAH